MEKDNSQFITHNSEIIIYTAPDGTAKLQVQLEDETVWLTQEQMAVLFGKGEQQ